jgi:hypothetical protein
MKELRNISQIQRKPMDILQSSQDRITMKLSSFTIFKERVASPIHQIQMFHTLIMDKMKIKSGLSQKLFTIKMSSRTPGLQDNPTLSKIHLHHGGVRNL